MGARAHHVRAAKDYPQHDISKGEMHWTWAHFRQKPQRSKTKPTRSQLEASEFKSRLYDIIDDQLPGCSSVEDLEQLANDVRELGEETREKVNDLPENFQQGEAGQKLETRADELDGWADEIDSAVEELGTVEEWVKKKAEEEHEGDEPFDSEAEIEVTPELAEEYAEAVAEKVDEIGQSAPDPE